MKVKRYTSAGMIEVTLTEQEIIEYAAMGDPEARQYVLKKDKQAAGNLQQRIEAIEKYLGV